MKYIQKSLSVLLALAMLFSLAPGGLTAHAEEITAELPPAETLPTEAAEEETAAPDALDNGLIVTPTIPTVPTWSEPRVWINPMYEDLVDADAFRVERPDYSPAYSYDPADYISVSEAGVLIRNGMQNRQSPITVYVRSGNGDGDAVFDSLYFESALAHTGVSDEGDYLHWNTIGYQWGYAPLDLDNNANYYIYEIYPYYITTLEQEAEVDRAVDSLLSQLNLWSKTDYEKVLGVYDWICSNITYDYEHLGSETYFLHHSTYSAIIQHHTVCQGYATLFYRLMLELGVDCRVITSVDHAWNIVELDNLYYNLDATWDSPPYYGYQWFLRCPANFPDHPREDVYTTAAFNAAYPMSSTDYDPNGTPGEPETTVTELELDVPVTVTVRQPGDTSYYSYVPDQSGYYTLQATSDGYYNWCEASENTNGDWSLLGGNEGYDFSYTAYLEADHFYHFAVGCGECPDNSSFQILLTRTYPDGSGRIENNSNTDYIVSDLVLGTDGIYRTPDGCIMYIAVANYADGGLEWLTDYLLPENTLYDYVNTYGSQYFDLTYWSALCGLMDEYGYVVLTDTTMQYLVTLISGNPNWEESAEYVPKYLFFDPTPSEPETAIPVLVPDVYTNVSVSNQTAVCYSFTPTVSGCYSLTSSSDVLDLCCSLYDSDWNHLYEDDDRGSGSNFYLKYNLEAGKTYYYEITEYYGSFSGSFQILLQADSPLSASGKYENYPVYGYLIPDLEKGSDGVYRTPEGGVVYIALANSTDLGLHYLHGNTLSDYVDFYGAQCFDITYWDELCGLMDKDGYVTLTDTSLRYLTTLISGNPIWGDDADDVWKYLFFDPASVHSYQAYVTVPTCTQQGYTTYICTDCGDSYVNNYTDALGHDYVNGICTRCGDGMESLELVSAPTVTSYAVGDTLQLAGIRVIGCFGSGETVELTAENLTVFSCDMSAVGVSTAYVGIGDLRISFPVYVHAGRINVKLDPATYPESDHNYETSADDRQTFTYPGASSLTLVFSDETYMEQGYDYIYVYDGNDALIASYTGDQAAGLTLTVPGDTAQIRLTSDYSRSYFGYSFSSIAASVVEHTGESADYKAPTCTEPGFTGEYDCKICGEHVEGQPIPATGHNFTDWGYNDANKPTRTCLNCGLVEKLEADRLFTVAGESSNPGLTMEQMRQLYAQVDWSMEPSYVTQPSAVAPYVAGRLTDACLDNLVAQVNFFRAIARLDNIGWAEEYVTLAQYGTVVNAANRQLTHYPSQPGDMDYDFYNKGYQGTSQSNLAMGYGLMGSVLGYLDDSDNSNIDKVGHRRWVLNPYMANTGFGYTAGFSAMYAFDDSNNSAKFDFVAYPGGSSVFPSEFFYGYYAWSTHLSRTTFRVPSLDELRVTLIRESDGCEWVFDANTSGTGYKHYFNLDTGGYGDSMAIIFRPGDISSYQGTYTVRITGLWTRSGESAAIEYSVNFQNIESLDCSHTPAVSGAYNATCTEPGYTGDTYCTDCGELIAAGQTIPATGHQYVSWYQTVAPSCETAGQERRDCSTCGYYETRTTDPLGHDYQEVVTEPTCIEQGYTTYTCENCGHTYADTYVPALGHSFVNYVSNGDATCTEDGTKTAKCSRCDATDTIPDPGSATGHNYEDVITEPTCTQQGFTTHICRTCGDTYTDSYGDPLPHDFHYTVITEPDKQNTGLLSGSCGFCGDGTTVVLPELNDGDYTCQILREPTENSTGLARYTWKITEYGEISFEITLPKLSNALLGDVNGDGDVDTTDAYLIVMYYNERMDLTAEQLLAADVDGNGEVDTTDAYYIVMYYNERIDKLPAAG